MAERKKIEEEFFKCSTEEAAQQLLDGLQLTNALISIHDPNGVYLQVSSSVTEFWGYRPQDLIGNSAYDYFHPDSIKDVLRSHASVNVRPGVERVDYRVRKADRSYLHVHTFSKTLKRKDGTEFILALTM